MAHQEGKCPGSLFLQHRNSSLNWKTDVIVILVVPVTTMALLTLYLLFSNMKEIVMLLKILMKDPQVLPSTYLSFSKGHKQ